MGTDKIIHAELSEAIIGAAMTNLRLALLINFKHADLRWKRVVR